MATASSPTVSPTGSSSAHAGTLAWGILGTGAIAKAFARGLSHTNSGRLVAVGSRSQASAEKFTAEFPADRAHGSYEALLADPAVQAVYVATPHPLHPRWVIASAEAGKHILCEKPLALNAAQAMAMIEAAREHNVFLMEAFMYRCHPQTRKLVELIRGGAIGQVRMIVASFGFGSGVSPESRLYKNELGGGAILDVGCYAVSAARLIAGAAQGLPFAEPAEVVTSGRVGETGVDEYAAAVLRFNTAGEEIVAQVSTSIRCGLENTIRVHGSDGWLLVPNPWTADRQKGGRYVIHVHRNGKPAEEVVVESDQTAFALEAEVVARAIAAGQTQPPSPAMTWDDSLGNLRTLDRWRGGLKQQYRDETPEGFAAPLHGRPLKKRDTTPMKYGDIAGVGKPISRFIMGCDNQPSFSHGAVMWDDWFERGGNAFDTAYVYGGGRQERLLGQWIKSRGVREQVVVISKGAHTPYCDPQNLTSQFIESLDRLQSDYADLYIMHRDNTDIPVGEFVDVLNEHLAAGRVRAFGGSNWSLERIAEANAYAEKNGKTGFSVVNNNFSLALMVDPVWAGCIHVSDEASKAWLTQRQMPNLSWSSQARGFFTDRAAPDKLEDKELVRCWYSPENFTRRDRAIELAKKKGVLPINIAAAYVLCQPFPSFALIGPRVLHETVTSMPGLEVELTQAELDWLATGK
jgi:predicted dehydrogenase/aryl-alcohol dehydrogenase-like predicted oxidoreductase